MKTIVVGVDGSDDARSATAWVAQLARQLDATVVAVHAVGLLEHQRSDPNNRRLQGQLEDWTCALDDLPGSRVRRQLLPGTPISAILQAVQAEKADLVAVGTRGVGARTGVLLGSTSLQLAEQCPCLLLIIPRAKT
ncbi:MAG: universal stress protein [Actinomycetota bacterium]|nr:universal stress protein [Actinomycetota bacterium]